MNYAKNVEIERKFLLSANQFSTALAARTSESAHISQGYFASTGNNACRVRMINDSSFITLKSAIGVGSCKEFEYLIPSEDGASILETCSFSLRKIRHYCLVNCFLWEVDEFLDEWSGLFVAECELQNKKIDGSFLKYLPTWIDPKNEKTSDFRYSNLSLSHKSDLSSILAEVKALNTSSSTFTS